MKINNNLIKQEVATAYLSSGELTNLGNVIIPFDVITSNTDRLTLSNHGIKIGSGVKQVMITGHAFGFGISTSSNPYLWVSIDKNSQIEAYGISAQSQGFAGTSIPPKIIDVQENDIIYLHKVVATPTSSLRGGANTWLTVEIVQ